MAWDLAAPHYQGDVQPYQVGTPMCDYMTTHHDHYVPSYEALFPFSPEFFLHIYVYIN